MAEKKEILISVIIPIYNSEQYLKECLESVINQTYMNLDILLIDDGSGDKSLNICKEYQGKDPRIRVISKKNEGVSATRNRGIKESKGQWISFVDSDDVIAQDYIKGLVMCLLDDTEICFVNSTKNLSELNNDNSNGFQITEISKDVLRLFERGLLNKYVINTPIHLTSTCAKLYNKEFLLENNIFFPENLAKSEDALFNMQVYHYAKKGSWYNQPLYYYRINNESATHRYDDNVVKTYQEHLRLIKDFYAEKKYPEFKADFNVRVFFDLIYCIVNKFCHIDNQKSYKERKKEFLSVVKMNPFQNGLKNVKANKFRFEEKILLFFIQRQFFLCMDLIIHVAQLI